MTVDDTTWSKIIAAVGRRYKPNERARPMLDWVLTNYPGQLRDADAIRMERERMRRIIEGIEALAPGLEALYRDLTNTTTEINLYDLTRGPTDDIAAARLHVAVASLLQALGVYKGPAFDQGRARKQLSFWYTRTSQPARDIWLYRGLFEVWTEHFGGQLGYSTSWKKALTGPLPRFLRITTGLVLNPPPSPRMLREAIEREVALRDRRADWE